MSAVQRLADEAHREQTSERVHESHTRSAKAGHVVGGRVFGYTNQDVFNGVDLHGRPLRSHVERVINPAEAAVVRRIFELYDAGEGLKRIAKTLMQRAGRARRSRSCGRDPTKVQPVVGWSPSTVRTILTRELYHGVIVWNKTRKRPITWGRWTSSRAPSRSGCARRPSTCASSTKTCGARPGSPAGDRRARRAVRERPSVGATAEARDAEPARRVGHVRALRRRADRRDEPEEARPGA